MEHLDPGIGNERTALAWQRTALAVLAAAAILSRLTFDRLGLLALVSLGASAPIALWLFMESRGRYLHDAQVRVRPRPRGGRAPLTLTIATLAIGLTELAALLVA